MHCDTDGDELSNAVHMEKSICVQIKAKSSSQHVDSGSTRKK